jgi:hypothetical protein
MVDSSRTWHPGRSFWGSSRFASTARADAAGTRDRMVPGGSSRGVRSPPWLYFLSSCVVALYDAELVVLGEIAVPMRDMGSTHATSKNFQPQPSVTTKVFSRKTMKKQRKTRLLEFADLLSTRSQRKRPCFRCLLAGRKQVRNVKSGPKTSKLLWRIGPAQSTTTAVDAEGEGELHTCPRHKGEQLTSTISWRSYRFSVSSKERGRLRRGAVANLTLFVEWTVREIDERNGVVEFELGYSAMNSTYLLAY